MTTICFIIPYFGRWPEWIDLYFGSCANNPSINWVFGTDCDPPESAPTNVRFRRMSWSECSRLIRETGGIKNRLSSPSKLCDFKFTLADVFRDEVAGMTIGDLAMST